ncbi:MAG TPA: DUF4097 family beta strand repeat-containing protein [Candidatus Izemoplasmatales bacterium]|nr:DUF4097 family beta strand repeat-containing protein [Candidatus Izemoplasmatales bacterium]
MKKYLESLRKELKTNGLNDIDIQDIINDLTEMIHEAMDEGLDEVDIPKKFGHPKDLAKDLAKDETNQSEKSKAKDGLLFSTSDIQMIDVKLYNEDINIVSGENDRIEVYGENVDRKNYKIYKESHCLCLERKNTLAVKFRIFRTSNEKFIIKLPKDYQLKDISLNIKSSDGGLNHIKTNRLTIRSVSGDLKISNVHGEDFQMKSISGDVNIKNTEWITLTISNVSGDFDINHTHVKDNIRINTVSGDVDIFESSGKELDYNAVSGDLIGKEFYPESMALKSISGDIKIKNKDQSKPIEIIRKRSLSGDIDI